MKVGVKVKHDKFGYGVITASLKGGMFDAKFPGTKCKPETTERVHYKTLRSVGVHAVEFTQFENRTGSALDEAKLEADMVGPGTRVYQEVMGKLTAYAVIPAHYVAWTKPLVYTA